MSELFTYSICTYVHVALLKNLQALQLSCYKSYHLHTCSYHIRSRFFEGKLIIFGCKNFIASSQEY